MLLSPPIKDVYTERNNMRFSPGLDGEITLFSQRMDLRLEEASLNRKTWKGGGAEGREKKGSEELALKEKIKIWFL